MIQIPSMATIRGIPIAPEKRRWPVLFLFTLMLVLLPASCSKAEKGAADTPELRTFLSRYFSTWSAQDMEGYGACFDPQARILFISKSGQIVSEGTIDFLHGQKMAHQTSEVRMTEHPVQMTIQGDAKVAQAAVTWVLNKGASEQRGTDFFTLRHDDGGWKIVTLVFYGD
jgi:hypothetical protein